MRMKRYLKRIISTIKKSCSIIERKYYTSKVKLMVASYGTHLRVNHRCSMNSGVRLGSHCNFNGMTIKGHGNVMIGDYFHSGTGCKIITQNHNYGGG